MKRSKKSPVFTPAVSKPEITPVEKILLARRTIEYVLERRLERCIRAKTDFIETLQKQDIENLDLAYIIKRSAEDVLLAGAVERDIRGMKVFFKENIDKAEGGVEFVLETIRKMKSDQEHFLLTTPYRHNSTCAMSNFQSECEFRAKAEFWHGHGFSTGDVSQIVSSLEDWLKAENELLEDYPLCRQE